ncbi:hypothetical protein GOV07_02535 [Candidatus Woesearchaeota archaeon]|nr:hypothetical protein [Candidatus Woesearchaeota archaeon]
METGAFIHGGLALAILALLFIGSAIVLPRAVADPAGATVINISTETVGIGNPGNRSDPGGTITTITLNAVQQNLRWKAYVGNVSGYLTLDDSSGNTIYDWTFTTAINGQVYVSRYDNLTFIGAQCANQTIITAEDTFNNVTIFAAGDTINHTFNYTLHKGFTVTSSTQIANDTCPTTYTYINDSSQGNNASNPFQETLLQDPNDYLMYVTLIEDNVAGYDLARNFDFQLLVAESDQKATPTTYYFYTNLV